MRIIIIGGTGMLSRATCEISRQAKELILIARSPGVLAEKINAKAISLNWKDKEGVRTSIAMLALDPKIDILLTWIHDDGIWCLPLFENLLVENGRSIRIHGSSAGDPAEGIKTDPSPPRDDIIRQNVVLGWVQVTGGRRWLTNDEISDGALDAFKYPNHRSIIVGQIDQPAASTSNRLLLSKL